MIESLDVILWDKKVGTLVANREGHRSPTIGETPCSTNGPKCIISV